MSHAALDVVHKPALTVGHHNRDALARNVAAVFQHLATAHDVLVNLARFDPLLPHLDRSDGCQCLFQGFIVGKVGRRVALFLPSEVFENAD